MKVLWITNITLPPVCEALNLPVPNVGGWMYSSLKRLKEQNPDTVVAVASIWNGTELRKCDLDGITYYLLPLKGRSKTKYNHHLEHLWKEIKTEFCPDVVHIHGSEFPHGLAYVRACGSESVVVSIQGIVSSIARYYTADISHEDIRRSTTFRDFLRGDISTEQKDFFKRGKLEKKLFQGVSYVIGRTQWDKAHLWAINPDANYYHVGETLRDSFYKYKWNYSKCEPYSIFVSQASYPIKGFHKLLEAFPLILREYPKAKIYVAGDDITSLSWMRLKGYGNILKKLINKYHLSEKVVFLGNLNEEQMCERYLASNLFICCSAIENSPNSLGEAQMLGMPHLASYVGGIPEIVNNNPEVLYRFEETEMLAKKICRLFELREKYLPVYFNHDLYDGNINTRDLYNVYSLISNGK